MNIQASPVKPSQTRARFLRALHRYLGLALILPVLLLAVTGALLEFTDPLKLGQAGVGVTWVQERYGISAPSTMRESAGVTQVGDQLFTPERHLKLASPLQGAAELELIYGLYRQRTDHRAKRTSSPG